MGYCVGAEGCTGRLFEQQCPGIMKDFSRLLIRGDARPCAGELQAGRKQLL